MERKSVLSCRGMHVATRIMASRVTCMCISTLEDRWDVSACFVHFHEHFVQWTALINLLGEVGFATKHLNTN